MIIRATLLTLSQMPQREMRGPLVKGVLATIAVMLALALTIGAWLSSWLTGWTIPFTTWQVGGAGGWLAGAGAFTALLFVFVPAAALAVSFFIDPVADAVEARHFPDVPRARPRKLSEDIWMGAKIALLALVVNIPLIPFYFLFPPLPAFVNGYLLGREYFTMAALRHLTAAEVKALRGRAFVGILLAGALLAFMVTIPLLNLLAPVFGAGLMTHVYNRARQRANLR